MPDKPLVTCLQLSYGRPHLSVEAVESFLRQTYKNKLLLIINTHHSPVRFARPYKNIKIHNVAPFAHLSDIYRYGMSLVKTKHFLLWDDDDIFLPWHIADRVNARLANPACNAVTHQVAFASYGNKIKSLDSNMFVSQYLYDKNNIKPDAGVCRWDVKWDQKPWNRFHLTLPKIKPSYIYRWDTGEPHVSGSETEKGQHENFRRGNEEKKKVNFPDPWIPAWKRDYVSDALNYMKKHHIPFI
jgi:hypothetical protein